MLAILFNGLVDEAVGKGLLTWRPLLLRIEIHQRLLGIRLNDCFAKILVGTFQHAEILVGDVLLEQTIVARMSGVVIEWQVVHTDNFGRPIVLVFPDGASLTVMDIREIFISISLIVIEKESLSSRRS